VVEFDEGGREEEEEGEEGEDGEGEGGGAEELWVEEGVGVFVEEFGAEGVPGEEGEGEEEPGEDVLVAELAFGDAGEPED
jgi:hypothetical protein